MYANFLKGFFTGSIIGAGITMSAFTKAIKDQRESDDKRESDKRETPAKLISDSSIESKIESIRDEDVKRIRKRMTLPISEIHGRYTVVRGPSGIGKSVAIETAARDLKGVIEIGPFVNESLKETVLDSVYEKITGKARLYRDNDLSMMKSIIEKYIETNKRSPIVIIKASQHGRYESSNGLTQAARILVNDFHLNVLIDSQENSLSYLTGREVFLDMEPMNNDMMRKLPGYENFFEMLKAQNNEEIVLAVCGGKPVFLDQLKDEIDQIKADENESIKNDVVVKFVRRHLFKALSDIQRLEQRYSKIQNLLESFKENKLIDGVAGIKARNYITEKMLLDAIGNYDMSDIKDVFRGVDHFGKVEGNLLVPANGAVAILLRNGKETDFDKVKKDVLSWTVENKND